MLKQNVYMYVPMKMDGASPDDSEYDDEEAV